MAACVQERALAMQLFTELGAEITIQPQFAAGQTINCNVSPKGRPPKVQLLSEIRLSQHPYIHFMAIGVSTHIMIGVVHIIVAESRSIRQLSVKCLF
jgi:hypothetical protein